MSVSPTNGIGSTQGQRKTVIRVGIGPKTFGFDHHCSKELQGEAGQVVGIEDVKFMVMNMYKYKEGLSFCKHWSCSTYIGTDFIIRL